MPTWFTSALWALVSLAIFATGILLLAFGLKPRFRGSDPHCAKCNYNLTGTASGICPECGTRRTSATVVCGQRYRRWMIAGTGIALSVLASASCIPVHWLLLNRPPAPQPTYVPGAKSNVALAKACIANLKDTLQAGIVPRPYEPGDLTIDAGSDRRMTILTLLIQDKLGRAIQGRVTDAEVKAAALAELAAANRLLTSQIIPAYDKAGHSQDPADAKTIVPLMDQLDKHMDQLQQILKGH